MYLEINPKLITRLLVNGGTFDGGRVSLWSVLRVNSKYSKWNNFVWTSYFYGA